MKLLALALLMCGAAFGQTEFTSIKLKNDPVTLNDTTKVDILVRENIGANKGMVRKIGWPYLASVLTGGLTLQQVAENGSIAAGLTTPVVFQTSNTLNLFSGSQATINASEVLINSTNPEFQGARYNADYSGYYTNRSLPDVEWVETQLDDKGSITSTNTWASTQSFPSGFTIPGGPAGSYISGTGSILNFGTNARNVPLTGFVSGAGTVSATDTFLQAFNKINGNIALKVSTTGNETISGVKTFSTSPVVPTQSPNDNSTNIASTAYSDAKVADFINDGATTIAPSQNAVFDAFALKANTTNNSTITFVNGAGIRNASNANNYQLMVGSSVTPPIWTRNTADAVTTAVFNNQHASNTGHIADFQSGGTSQVNITKTGNVYFPDTADGIVLTSPDGTKYLVTVANGGTLQTSTITTP